MIFEGSFFLFLILTICCDIFSYFSFEPYVVTPHLNRLIEMRGAQQRFLWRIDKNYP